METQARTALVKELTALLHGGQAYVTFERAVADLPAALRNQAVLGVPYTIWQLVEHLRIAQADILEFCLNPQYVELAWPAAYWPDPAVLVDETGWQAALAAIAADQQQFIDLLHDPATDLFTPLPHGTGQNVLREALLIGDHNSYHVGEIVLLRKLLGAWG